MVHYPSVQEILSAIVGGLRRKHENLLINNLGYYCLFVSPSEVTENNDVNDDGLPIHVDEVGVFDYF